MSNQFLETIEEIFGLAFDAYNKGEVIEQRRVIPTTDDIPLETNKWLKIDDVVCVYIDMMNSTRLSAVKHASSTAGIYQYFTGTAVRLLDHFGAVYIDVRGDGAFGLFQRSTIYRALASAVTFRTFMKEYLNSDVKKRYADLDIRCHIGLDIGTVLVKRIGMRRSHGTSTKQNEVWAGKPVNMAAKLASFGAGDETTASERVFKIFKEENKEPVLFSCGCGNEQNEKKPLWTVVSVKEDSRFDFEDAYKLISPWCVNHGQEYCRRIISFDR